MVRRKGRKAPVSSSIIRNTLPGLSLETLPPDIIVEMLNSYDDYIDLHALISASAVFYKHFSRYSSSILTQVAKNIIGKDAWEAATAVLVYQRNAETIKSGLNTVRKELEEKFVLQPRDIPRLVANQRYFDRCCENFPDFLHRSCPRPTDVDYKPLTHLYVPLVSPAQTNPCPNPSFTAGDTFPIGLFYQTWLFGLRFGFESFTTFAGREQHIPLADLWAVSRVMHVTCSRVEGISGLPTWTLGIPRDSCSGMPKDNYSRRFIDKWGGQGRFSRVLQNQNTNDLLRMKASLCLRPHFRSGVPFWKAEKRLVRDYRRYTQGEITLEAFVEIYNLDGTE